MNLFGVLKYKKMGEDFVRNSGLPYTIIRYLAISVLYLVFAETRLLQENRRVFGVEKINKFADIFTVLSTFCRIGKTTKSRSLF